MNALKICALAALSTALFSAPLVAQAAPTKGDVGVHRVLGSDLLGHAALRHVFAKRVEFEARLDAAIGVGAGAVAKGVDQPGAGSAGGMRLRGIRAGGGFGRIRGMGPIDALGVVTDRAPVERDPIDAPRLVVSLR